MSEQIRVAVQGALGRMGQEILATLAKEPDMLPVGGADHFAKGDTLALPGASGTIPLSTSLADVIADADVVVDFTNGEGAADAIDTVPASGKHLVIGSTGIPADAIERAEKLAAEHNVGIFIAPNFTIGVAVMMHLVREAARFFDYADLVETHHEAKIDAPSGTALAIAAAAAEAKGGAFNAPTAEKELVPERAAATTREWSSIRRECRAKLPTTRWSSATSARRSPSSTTRSTARASCPVSCSPSARLGTAPASPSAWTS